MRPDDFEARLRIFETAQDRTILPQLNVVVRLDGRGFTKLTKERLPLERPFDPAFRDAMIATTQHVMDCGFRALFGYTQSDEISVLLHPDDGAFSRLERKFLSVLAGEASAAFSLAIGTHGVFDARLAQLPTRALVVDYFRWRQQDAGRNALNGHCYWLLRAEGKTPDKAQQLLERTSVAAKHDLLFERGINFDKLPVWQKRGIGVRWESYEKPGVNPLTGAQTLARRQRPCVDAELPLGDDFSAYLDALVPPA